MGWATKAMASTPRQLDCGCVLRTTLPYETQIATFCDEHWDALPPSEQSLFLKRRRMALFLTIAMVAALAGVLVIGLVFVINAI